MSTVLQQYQAKPTRLIAHVWYATMGLAVIDMIVAGTFILRKHKTPSAVGFLLGGGLMVSQMFFTIFCVFAGFAHDASVVHEEEGTEDSASTADRWMAAFAFFIFLATMAFTLVLAKFRSEVIPVSMMDDATAAAAAPKAGQVPATTAV
ncbi:hypothetical protein TeGR_g12987 [Tetraparma gracilis]|uniref:MARVEL domain-containing protein n=1 Tax=Tetraparma gracilis TaxID=2962635 RepID=A0ABQ6MN88_9STRA|nr:hypothetical protein TeGR_g12987 [Tetraparma gracilis]